MQLGQLIRSILFKPSSGTPVLARNRNSDCIPGLSSASMLAPPIQIMPMHCETISRPRLSSANELGAVGPDVGLVAAMFVSWLRARSPTGIWVSNDLTDLAWHNFADETGTVAPHPRTLLSAIKAGGQMQFRANCRLYRPAGKFLRKATLYGFAPLPGSISIDHLSDTFIGL